MAQHNRSLLALAKRVNNFYLSGLRSADYLPLLCQDTQVSLSSPPSRLHTGRDRSASSPRQSSVN